MSNIVGVSDVPIGYGSPQISLLLSSLAEFYKTDALVYEVDLICGNREASLPSRVKVEKLTTLKHPHQAAGISEFNVKVLARLNADKPPIVCIFNSNNIGLLSCLRYKPKLVIYYVLEMPFPEWHDANFYNIDHVDLFIFPEENRALDYIETFRVKNKPIALLYNASFTQRDQLYVTPFDKRNGRIMYAGTLGHQTLAQYYLSDLLSFCDIDLYGRVCGEDAESLERYLIGAVGRVRYHGMVSKKELSQVMSQYSFSVCMWNPDVPNQYFACPNKFFDSVACGVPVIAAPHPQVKALIDRYQCGVLMESWDFDAFINALRYASKIQGTEVYRELVDNARFAFETELNWNEQFRKIIPFLPEWL